MFVQIMGGGTPEVDLIIYVEIVAEVVSEMVRSLVCAHIRFCLPSLCESWVPGKSSQAG